MQWALLLCMGLVGLVAGGKAVVELTDKTFDETVGKQTMVMVLFYAPWCAKSKAFLPEYRKAAEVAKQLQKPYILAQIDASAEAEIADREQISEYPLLKLYINGTAMKYDKELTTEAVIRFIERIIRPPSVELKSVQEATILRQTKGVKCVLVGGTQKDLEEYAIIAKALPDYPFFHVDAAIGQSVFPEVQSVPAFVLLKGSEEAPAVFSGGLSTSAIGAFISERRFALVNNMTQEVLGPIFKPNARAGVVLYREAKDSHAAQYEQEFLKLATAHKSPELLFIVSDVKDVLEAKVIKHIGLEGAKMPFVVIIKKVEGIVRYEYHGEIALAPLDQFVSSYRQGKLSPTLKSEEEPKSNPGPVYKVVGKTFQRDVLDNPMDIFVKFYAPWCGHCQELAPVYKALAESLTGNPNLKLVEIDSTANEIPGHNVKSYPTLKLFVGNNKTHPIPYEEKRTSEAMLQFLQKQAHHPILLGNTTH